MASQSDKTAELIHAAAGVASRLPEVVWEDHILAMLDTPALWALLDTAKRGSNPFWSSVRARVVRHHNILIVGGERLLGTLATNVRVLKAWTRRLSLVPNVEMPPIRVLGPATVGSMEPAVVDFQGVKIVGCSELKNEQDEADGNDTAVERRILCHSRIFVLQEDFIKAVANPGSASGDGESKAASPVIGLAGSSGSVTLENLCLANCMVGTDADDGGQFRFAAKAGIWVHGQGTLATLSNCTVANEDCGMHELHGMHVDQGGIAQCTGCEFRGNRKSGVFLRGQGSSVMLARCRLVLNQDYGVSVERGGEATLMDGCVVSQNQWYGLGCWGKGSVITLASRDVIVAENTNDSYGSKYGYQKSGGLIQLMCD